MDGLRLRTDGLRLRADWLRLRTDELRLRVDGLCLCLDGLRLRVDETLLRAGELFRHGDKPRFRATQAENRNNVTQNQDAAGRKSLFWWRQAEELSIKLQRERALAN